MKTRITLAVLSTIVLVTLALAVFVPAQPVFAQAIEQGRGPGRGPGGPGGGGGQGNPGGGPGGGQGNPTCPNGPCTDDPLTPLADVEKESLQRAILEEYGAQNLYQGVIDQFGPQIPFSQIVRAETQHVNALQRQADKYGVEIPANPGLTSPTTFSDLAAACAAGVEAEKVDAALYDQLKPSTTHSDILNVYNNLQSASLNKHLPQFQDCAE